jgi:hypothetical protein
MTRKGAPKWKRFEALVAKVQSSLSPDAKVTLDESIPGLSSHVKRQIDITVRRNIGQFEILIVIDCKDYTRPVDVKDIEEFIGLVEDVGANKGAMVSASGFTEAAKTRAQGCGIDLYRLVDAEEHDWQAYVSIPIVCDFRSLGSGRYKIDGSATILEEIASQDPRLIPLFDNDHNEIGTPLILLWAKWNKGDISDEPGSYLDVSLSSEPICMRAKDGHYEAVRIFASGNVVRKLYHGQLLLTQITGFRDEASGAIVLPPNAVITTDVINTVEVETTWPEIPSLDALATKPVLTLSARDHYPSKIPTL